MIRNENQMYIDMGRKEGIKEGKKEGRKEGKKEGRKEYEKKLKQERIEIAQKLLKLKMPVPQISEITKLKQEEIEKIK